MLNLWVCKLRLDRRARRGFFLRYGPGRDAPPLPTRRENDERHRLRETSPARPPRRCPPLPPPSQPPPPPAPEPQGNSDEKFLRILLPGGGAGLKPPPLNGRPIAH